MFRCFKRTWWKENQSLTNGLEPSPGPKSYFKGAKFTSEIEAREFCRDWNSKNPAGRYSLKAEFE